MPGCVGEEVVVANMHSAIGLSLNPGAMPADCSAKY